MWVYVSDVASHGGEEVTIRGWLYNRRSSGKLRFLLVRDGTGTIQCVVSAKEVSSQVFDTAGGISQESAVTVRGVVRQDPRSPLGFEILLRDLEVTHRSEGYPITPKEHGTAFLLDHRHLWLRSSRQQAIMRVRSELVSACRDYFNERGFTLLDAPILTPNACEGTTSLFQVDYFGGPAFLTQSGQLYMEAGAAAFGKVYCFGPTFRAEKSKTRRHLTEFWMIEPEVAYLDLEGDMDLAEDFVAALVKRVLAKCRRELAELGRDLEPLFKVKKPFPRISYDEARALLKSKGTEMNWGKDLGGDEETLVSHSFDRPVLVHRYPAQCKAFYMKRDPDNPKLALCVDMLAPEGFGEIVGGGQREDDLARLEEGISHHNLPPGVFSWYIDLRRFGSVPHSGFGMGIERVVAWLCGLHHVRETIPFPRMLERLTP